jgi:hypothetical protein
MGTGKASLGYSNDEKRNTYCPSSAAQRRAAPRSAALRASALTCSREPARPLVSHDAVAPLVLALPQGFNRHTGRSKRADHIDTQAANFETEFADTVVIAKAETPIDRPSASIQPLRCAT